jgi:hypothetical protein
VDDRQGIVGSSKEEGVCVDDNSVMCFALGGGQWADKTKQLLSEKKEPPL